MRLVNHQVLPAGTTNASVNSAAFDASSMFAISGQIVFTDVAATGTAKLQFSNDFSNNGDLGSFVPTNWNDIPSATVTVTVGSTNAIPMVDVCYQWIRLVWTRTAGAGTLIATIKSNGF